MDRIINLQKLREEKARPNLYFDIETGMLKARKPTGVDPDSLMVRLIDELHALNKYMNDLKQAIEGDKK